MLVLTRKPNQNITIGGNITIKVMRIKGNSIQLGIEAPKDVSILRSELADRVQNSSKQESTSPSEETAHDSSASTSMEAEEGEDIHVEAMQMEILLSSESTLQALWMESEGYAFAP